MANGMPSEGAWRGTAALRRFARPSDSEGPGAAASDGDPRNRQSRKALRWLKAQVTRAERTNGVTVEEGKCGVAGP